MAVHGTLRLFPSPVEHFFDSIDPNLSENLAERKHNYSRRRAHHHERHPKGGRHLLSVRLSTNASID
jgi:hypothetical protein